jgi:hypothetical protein
MLEINRSGYPFDCKELILKSVFGQRGILFLGNDKYVIERSKVCKLFANRLSEELFQSDIPLVGKSPMHLESPPDAVEETPTLGTQDE